MYLRMFLLWLVLSMYVQAVVLLRHFKMCFNIVTAGKNESNKMFSRQNTIQGQVGECLNSFILCQKCAEHKVV